MFIIKGLLGAGISFGQKLNPAKFDSSVVKMVEGIYDIHIK